MKTFLVLLSVCLGFGTMQASGEIIYDSKIYNNFEGEFVIDRQAIGEWNYDTKITKDWAQVCRSPRYRYQRKTCTPAMSLEELESSDNYETAYFNYDEHFIPPEHIQGSTGTTCRTPNGSCPKMRAPVNYLCKCGRYIGTID